MGPKNVRIFGKYLFQSHEQMFIFTKRNDKKVETTDRIILNDINKWPGKENCVKILFYLKTTKLQTISLFHDKVQSFFRRKKKCLKTKFFKGRKRQQS